MAIGRRTPKQDELFIPTAKVATGPGHPFYTKLNAVLAEAGFVTGHFKTSQSGSNQNRPL